VPTVIVSCSTFSDKVTEAYELAPMAIVFSLSFYEKELIINVKRLKAEKVMLKKVNLSPTLYLVGFTA